MRELITLTSFGAVVLSDMCAQDRPVLSETAITTFRYELLYECVSASREGVAQQSCGEI